MTPLRRVGCYVPAGRYPLPSSLLMTAIPARVAGVPEVVVVCPNPGPATLAAAAIADVARVFRLGGAQAVAALAYGTETVPRVDKIVGPGSAWVAAAKTRVSADCPIDFHAGPTEIVIVAAHGETRWIAADLIAQAEHDPDARAVVLTPDRRFAARIARRVETQLPADGPARASIERNGVIVVTGSLDEAVDLANDIAPEHLVCLDEDVAARATRAGAVFVGPHAAQAAGDYATGSNHVLPTGGAARFRGGLSASDFVHVHSVQRITRAGLEALAPTVLTLAEAEGLDRPRRVGAGAPGRSREPMTAPPRTTGGRRPQRDAAASRRTPTERRAEAHVTRRPRLEGRGRRDAGPRIRRPAGAGGRGGMVRP